MRDKIIPLFSFPVISLLFIAAVLPFATGIIPMVHFTSERIDVHVYPDEIVVDGYYFYKNPFPFPIVQGFTIPFPIDKDHPMPTDVQVERLTPVEPLQHPACPASGDLSGNGTTRHPVPTCRDRGVKEEIRIRRSFGSTGFEAYFPAYEEAEIRVSYRQKARRENATYILTTTRPWGRPLESGEYTLYTHGTIIGYSNYPLDLPGKAPRFHKTRFMPDKDWQFTWRNDDERGI